MCWWKRSPKTKTAAEACRSLVVAQTERKPERPACTAAPYLSLILAPDFTAGMQRWDQSLSVLNEHGMVTVLKTTRPRNRGLGCSNRYGRIPTKAVLFSTYLILRQTWQSMLTKPLGLRMFTVCYRSLKIQFPPSVIWQIPLNFWFVLAAVSSDFTSHIPRSAYKRKTQVANTFLVAFP